MFLKAKPIWLPGKQKVNQYVAFRQLFMLTSTTSKKDISLTIRADSQYVIWLNGRKVGFGQYPDYPGYAVCDTYLLDNTWMQEGENLLACLGYCQNEDSSTYRRGTASVIFELTVGSCVVAASGNNTRCSSENGYRSGSMEKFTNQLSYSFFYDMNHDCRWKAAMEEPANGWGPAAVQRPEQLYVPRPIHKLEISPSERAYLLAQGVYLKGDGDTPATRVYMDYLRPAPIATDRELPACCGITVSAKNLPAHDGCYLLVDLGRETAGYVSLDLEVPYECNLDVGFGEHLDDLRVRSFVGGRQFGFGLKLKPGRNVFTHELKRIGARYLQLHINCNHFTLYEVGIRSANYPVNFLAMPQGLDPLEKQIYSVSVDTLRLCMHEHYEDSPWREQALYSMDGRNQMLCGYYAFGEYTFARESLRLLAYGLREDGLLELCAPARIPLTIPSFSLMWIYALEEYARYSGDIDFLQEMAHTVKKVLATFIDRMVDGLTTIFIGDPYWNFYEWKQGLDGVHPAIEAIPDAALNAFFGMALQAASAIEIACGRDPTQYQGLYHTLRTTYNDAFWDSTSDLYRLYKTDSYEKLPVSYELVQALALRAGFCNHPKLLLGGLAEGRYDIACSLSHTLFKYEALLDDPHYHAIIRERIADTWGSMLLRGATSFWETEAGTDDFEGAGSLCHGWSAIPVYLYHRLASSYR